MKSILEDLWYSNVFSKIVCQHQQKEINELLNYIKRHRTELEDSLTDRQKESFKKYNDCYDELNAINERQIFLYAFKLGARITIEIMNFDNEQNL